MIVIILVSHMLDAQEASIKIRSKKIYNVIEGLKRLAEEEVYDTKGLLTMKAIYGYDGKELYSVEKKYYYYSKTMDSILCYYYKKKDSVLVMREIDHKKNGLKNKLEFFERLNTKPVYSYIIVKHEKRGADSTVYENCHLYSGDSILRTFKFLNKKLTTHIELKNGKPEELTNYVYDPKGQLIKRTSESVLWGNTSTEEFTYENGYKSKSIVRIKAPKSYPKVIIYTYDEKGNETSMESNEYINGYKSGLSAEKVQNTYIYNKGLLIEKKMVSEGIRGFQSSVIYEYQLY